MAKAKELVTKPSEPAKVDAYIAKLKHPWRRWLRGCGGSF
jgi:hypothetical protein